MILGIVCAALIKLRRDDNKNKAFFKLRYGNFLAVLGIIISVGLLLSSKSNEFRDTLITLFIGVLVYFGYQIFQIKKGKN